MLKLPIDLGQRKERKEFTKPIKVSSIYSSIDRADCKKYVGRVVQHICIKPDYEIFTQPSTAQSVVCLT